MAHAVTGKDGAVTWGGGVINGKLQEWTLEFEGNAANDRGAGESWDSQVPLFSQWRVTFRAYALDQAEWAPSGTSSEVALINATTTIALKRKAADTNPYFTHTGLTTSIRRTHGIGAASEYEVTVEGSEGTAPTIDTTPT